ncbi:MAG: FKBP-type peptidyl-prolyl cis-trans isomerase [Buchnera aphidicola (Kaburagia rhusicola rhusicola)]
MFLFLFRGIVVIIICFFSSIVFSKMMDPSLISSQLNITFLDKNFKNDNDQSSYALGVSLGNYINHFFVDQNKLGVHLNKEILLSGIKDSIFLKSKLSASSVSQILNQLEKKLLRLEENIKIKEKKINAIEGKKYIKKLLMQNNMKCSKTGLVFLIKKEGQGLHPRENDIVTVHYVGSLIDGHEFDNSYKRGKPLSFALNNVILGWKEGLKYIKKGGKIKLVIPPSLAYGEDGVPGIPGNSTLIFDIELINIKSKL